MENRKNQDSNSKMVLILAVVAILMALVLIANKTVGNYKDNGNEANSEVMSEISEVINNTSDLDKLKGSEYTSDIFDSVAIGDSLASIEGKFSGLEKIESAGEFDAYLFEDEALGSNYVFYFSNDELKEVSVFLV